MADCDEKKAHALNILKKSKGTSWEPDEEALKEILMSQEVKDKKVMLVSIAGPSRSGKSFLLNLLLEIACAVEQGFCRPEKTITLSTNSGFSWRGGSKKETSGINMWSKPFLLKNLDGEEIAVLFIDTEGFFDAKSTWEGCARIFALSNLISSVQVYNLRGAIQQDFLKHVEIFGQYGLHAIKEKKTKPFQNLLCLVRDWTFEFDHSYGFDGGESYLKEFTEFFSVDMIISKVEMITCIQKCTSLFNCNTVPPPKALFELIGEVFLEKIFQDCKETYKEDMNTFLKAREEARENATLEVLYNLRTIAVAQKSPVVELQELNDCARIRVLTKFQTCLGDRECEASETYRQRLVNFTEASTFLKESRKAKSVINNNVLKVQKLEVLLSESKECYSQQLKQHFLTVPCSAFLSAINSSQQQAKKIFFFEILRKLSQVLEKHGVQGISLNLDELYKQYKTGGSMTNEELKRLYEQSKVVALASLEAEIKKVAEGPSVKWISDLEEYIERKKRYKAAYGKEHVAQI
ncbi:unnamed protein product [Enterobius vermicularis]|uniref:GB1/RHD3-type G domain-containing protein n=1 Tax=Enterobius vermicularis TaxID=51028 RepID=A0A0N4VI21_ENTVE|nr:unnamed protein product [Enterobius vermicularis]